LKPIATSHCCRHHSIFTRHCQRHHQSASSNILHQHDPKTLLTRAMLPSMVSKYKSQNQSIRHCPPLPRTRNTSSKLSHSPLLCLKHRQHHARCTKFHCRRASQSYGRYAGTN
jgi:hypothetical protein